MFSRIKNLWATIKVVFSTGKTVVWYSPAILSLLKTIGPYAPMVFLWIKRIIETIGSLGLVKTLEKMATALQDETDSIRQPPRNDEERKWLRKRAERRRALDVLEMSEDDYVALRNMKPHQHTA